MAKKFLSVKAKCSFPLPDKTSFRDGKRGQHAILGFEYIEKLTPELADIVRCRVYRLEPPIDMRLIGKNTTDIDIWEGPLKFTAEEYEKHFYHTYGAGAYKIIVEEQGLSGVVCDIWFTLPDRDGYPPKIDDRTLCVDHPLAKDYIDWRARRGDLVAGQEPEKPKEEEDFMGLENGTGAALVGGIVDVLKDQVKNAKDEARELKQELREAKEVHADPSGPSTSTMVQNGAVDLAFSSAKKVIDNVMEHAGSRYDPPNPVQMAKELLDIMPKPDTTATTVLMQMLTASQQQVAQLQADQMTMLRNELAEMRKERQNPEPAANGHSKSFTEELTEFAAKAEVLGYKKGDGAAAAESNKGEIIKMVVENMPMINAAITAIGTILVPMFRPVANPAPVTQPGPAVVEQVPQPVQQQPPSPEQINLHFLNQIKDPFVAHFLSPDCSGLTLAEHLITGGTGASTPTIEGRAYYSKIKSQLGPKDDGSCGMDRLIRTFPPIWGVVESDVPKYSKFLVEFFAYDEVMQGDQKSA